MKRLLLDMDPGIDDALALLLALGAEQNGEVAIEGITAVAGNVEAERAAENICRILELAGRAYRLFQPGDVDQPAGDVDRPGCLPVAAGAKAPLHRLLQTARFVHGEDGLGNTGLPPPKERIPKERIAAHSRTAAVSSGVGTGEADAAVALIREKAARWPGEVTLVATGPLTNVARALSASPGLARELREIVLMGGAATVPGNATPVAEFNIFANPEAAAAVFSSGARLTMVGLDVTTQVAFTAEDLKAWRGVEGPVAGFVCALAEFWFSRFKKAEFHLHDPVAVGVALERSLVRTRRERVYVETRGEFTTGQTVVDRRPVEFRKNEVAVRSEVADKGATPGWPGLLAAAGDRANDPALPEICLEIDVDRFKRYFWEKITGGIMRGSTGEKIAGKEAGKTAGKTNRHQSGKKA